MPRMVHGDANEGRAGATGETYMVGTVGTTHSTSGVLNRSLLRKHQNRYWRADETKLY